MPNNQAPVEVIQGEARARLNVFVADSGPSLAPYEDHNGFGQHDRLRTDIRAMLAFQSEARAGDGDVLQEFANQENEPILQCLRQYIDDFRYPPTGDSIQRRIERAERLIASLLPTPPEGDAG